MTARAPHLRCETDLRLGARPARAPRRELETAAVLAIVDEIAERPGNALFALCHYALDLCDAGSAGISLFTTAGAEAELYWPAIAGAWRGFAGGSIATRGSPASLAAEYGVVLHFDDVETRFPGLGDRQPRIEELLVAPVQRMGKAVGALWVMAHDPERHFDREDLRLLGTLARCAAAADAARRGDQAVRAADERLALATSSSQVLGLWDWDVPNDLVTSDARFAQLYGVAPERAQQGASIAEFFRSIHPDDLPRVAAAIREALRTGHRFNEEYRLMQSGGDVRWVMAEGQAVLGPDGQPTRFPGISFDITARREAEDRLRDLNARLTTQMTARSSTADRT